MAGNHFADDQKNPGDTAAMFENQPTFAYNRKFKQCIWQLDVGNYVFWSKSGLNGYIISRILKMFHQLIILALLFTAVATQPLLNAVFNQENPLASALTGQSGSAHARVQRCVVHPCRRG
ncbi:unnamed protein product [Bursaphelenchus xylophilus]|uniref:(pine wood nematode) hypothetical protein n=1 Tax=Bursaphelenchus xylophilus TaxID=6326 RepID=A0A7I8XEH4_BURXY|nr:unnamed protein product [Bursaphelenchus xylophilus]CAG9113980.1 unnamed protein product [Bursaphelenchus xylophilus]